MLELQTQTSVWSVFVIVANLVRNGCGTDERTRAKILEPRPFFLHCHTHYFGNVRDHAQKQPTTPIEIYGQKQGSILRLGLCHTPFVYDA